MALPGQHKTRLEIDRARKGIGAVRNRINSLAALRSKLDTLLLPRYATDEPYQIEMKAQIKAVRDEIEETFWPSYSKDFKYMEEAVK